MNKHASHRHSYNESSEALLKKAGLKMTVARKAVMEILLKNHGPLTIEQISKAIRTPKCDLVTVYRITEAFEKNRLINRCDFGDGIARYEFNPADDDHHHHHIICRSCESVEPLDLCVVQTWENALETKGYSDLSHKLEFFGVCKSCTSSNPSSKSSGVKNEALL